MIIKPYLLVPRLIPQPTWGGDYIARFKGLSAGALGQIKIGQSYELATESNLSSVARSTLLPIEIGSASDGSVQEIIGDRASIFSLQSLIDLDPNSVLGKRVAESSKNQMRILIKFTQAKGNSFQVHIRPGVTLGNWKSKPESWFFFQKGKATLGLKSPTTVDEYRQVCVQIDALAHELNSKIQNPNIKQGIDQARKELQEFIATHSPFAFVNEITVEPNTVIDLSAGGIHHSWEEGAEIPDGNIVYEVQVNVMDKECTLRSFDKGKINDDGSLRPIYIDDYFAALDTDPNHNDPGLYSRPVVGGQIFDTPYYKSTLLEFAGQYQGEATKTDPDQSFHHLFVKSGSMSLATKDVTLQVEQGACVFIPALTGDYSLRAHVKTSVIKTWG